MATMQRSNARSWKRGLPPLVILVVLSSIAILIPASAAVSGDAVTWFNEGNGYFGQGKYDEAIECYDRAIEIDPNIAPAWNNKGNALSDLKRYDEAIACYDEAIACYDQAIEIDPKYANAWGNKGYVLAELGRYDEAIACYDRAIEIDPNLAYAWKNKGAALGSLGQPLEALGAHGQAAVLDPNRYAAPFAVLIVLIALPIILIVSGGVLFIRSRSRKKPLADKAADPPASGSALPANQPATPPSPAPAQQHEKTGKELPDTVQAEPTLSSHPDDEHPRDENPVPAEKTESHASSPAKQNGTHGIIKRIRATFKTRPEKDVADASSVIHAPPKQPETGITIERTIYDPVSGEFILDSPRPLDNVKKWIKSHDPTAYWLICCVKNNADDPIGQWAIELETAHSLKVTAARVADVEREINIRQGNLDAWRDRYILGILRNQGIYIPNQGSKQIYFKLGATGPCPSKYEVSGTFRTDRQEIPIRQKEFTFSCDVATLGEVMKTNPKVAEQYLDRHLAAKHINASLIMIDITKCRSRGEMEALPGMMRNLIDALEAAGAGEQVTAPVRDLTELDLRDGMGGQRALQLLADEAEKLMPHIFQTWMNETLHVSECPFETFSLASNDDRHTIR